MQIPTWVETGLRTKSERRSARLKFLINNLAARCTKGGSVRQFAEFIGMDHSTISGYISKGSFSEASAHTIVIKLNDPTITVEMFTDPMSLPRGD